MYLLISKITSYKTFFKLFFRYPSDAPEGQHTDLWSPTEVGIPPLTFPRCSPTPGPDPLAPLPRRRWSDSRLPRRGGNRRAEERQLRWDSQTQKSPAKRHTPTLPMCILALQPLHISRASVEQMRPPVRRQRHPSLLTWLIWCQSCPCHRPQFGLTRQGHACSVDPLGATDHLIWEMGTSHLGSLHPS